MKLNYQIILASKSPRRRQLLQDMGFEFKIRTKNTEEVFPDTLPIDAVPAFLSRQKAMAFEPEITHRELIIASDTVVIHQNKILGKPQSKAEAYDMIYSFSEKKHTVISGVTVLTKKRSVTESDSTDVYFGKLEEAEIENYVEKYQPFDKAGAYGIQEMIGMIGIRRIEGSYFNVMGLPTHLLWKILKTFQDSKFGDRY